MKPNILTNALIFFACLFASMAVAQADELDDLKSSMSKRLAAVDKLKSDRKAGEANTGLLAPKGAMSDAEKATMTAENKDRQAVYAIIAEKTNKSAAFVGTQRAASLRKSSAKGVWLQDAKGKWYLKQ